MYCYRQDIPHLQPWNSSHLASLILVEAIYPQTEVAHYLSSDWSSTLPTKGRQSGSNLTPCLTGMGLRTCLSVSGLHVSKRNGSVLLVLLPSGSTVKTVIKTLGLYVKGHICEALPARNVTALTPPLTENSGNWAGNHFLYNSRDFTPS